MRLGLALAALMGATALVAPLRCVGHAGGRVVVAPRRAEEQDAAAADADEPQAVAAVTTQGGADIGRTASLGAAVALLVGGLATLASQPPPTTGYAAKKTE
mmetsp:Transcript_7056/g.22279  ORF Transcript_7056/g.22279 Transcript_7056/m.22279 type:complete len:101 (-) Transcript_7056:103-405(-)